LDPGKELKKEKKKQIKKRKKEQLRSLAVKNWERK